LAVPLVGGGRFDIDKERPEHFTFVVFYRGLHCPICRTQLGELETKRPEFAKRGVNVVALSSDTAERAERAKQEWQSANLRLRYGPDLAVARAWGLSISAWRCMSSTGVEEPALFSEPRAFLVRWGRTLSLASVQAMACAGPHFSCILAAFGFVSAK